MINARAETVKSKPADRNALRQRRGRIPAVGLDEWKSGKGGTTSTAIRRDSAERCAMPG
jgi:putative SOS response-associated peptidase YedK